MTLPNGANNLPRHICQVYGALLDALFDEFDILLKVDDQRLLTEVAYQSPATNPQYEGCTSKILKHMLRDSNPPRHIATTHIIVDPDGNERHRHGKDFILQDVKLVREPETDAGYAYLST